MNGAPAPTTTTSLGAPTLGVNVPLFDMAGLTTSSVTGMGGTGPGQDFVLFDDASHNRQEIPGSTSVNSLPVPLSIVTDPSSSIAGAFQNPAAFTQYRNVPQQGSAVLSANGNESPFSSPASKPEDDFSPIVPGVGTAGPSQIPPSGTLSKGTPKSKRARGHGYSSSWNGGNLQQHLHQLQQSSSPPFPPAQPHMGGVPMAANSSFNGFQGTGSGSDWSGSDTSPRNPPSGTFGPPIHSLSLADGAPDFGGLGNNQLASLFPSTAGQMQHMTAATTMANNLNAIAALTGSPTTASINAQLSAQQQQENRARQQIRADLIGVDSRALKGQLRDIQQGSAPMSFPTYDSSASQSNNILFPFAPSTTLFGQGTRQNEDGQASMLVDQLSHSVQSQSRDAQNRGQQQTASNNPPAQPMRQFSARTQQAVDRARAQQPTRKRFVRENSEQTVSPQDAFLDYEDIDAMLQASQNPTQSLASGPSLFASMPTTTNATMDMAKAQSQHEPKAASAFGFSTPRAITDAPIFPPAKEGTPSLIDGSSSTSSNSRATSSVPSPPQRLPLSRGETVRPSRQQQERDSASQQSQQSSQSSAFSRSDLGLLSPAESTTSSTEDDEDEKPYIGLSSQRAQPSFGQASSYRGAYGANTIGSAGGGGGWGPRFSVVSSSSSESEDDFSPQQRGHANALSSSQQSFRGAADQVIPTSQQQAVLGNAGQAGPASIAALLASGGGRPMHQPPAFIPPLDANAAQVMQVPTPLSSGDAPSESGSQSQDEGVRKSPAIRSSAQAINPFASNQGFPPFAGLGALPLQQQQLPAAMAHTTAFPGLIGPVTHPHSYHHPQHHKVLRSEDDESEEWDDSEGDDDGEDDEDASPYRETQRSRTGTRGKPRKARGGGTASTRRHSQGAGGGGATHAGATTTSNGLTVCNYISPLTGEECGTEFHRPYDLARHRETIHAREEATLLRQGKITKEQCVVLYKEVDPAKSLATVEWRCDGSSGCGALFSRKDALLRHRRIRNH